ncbi:hypothetical protein VTI74DRAFT_10476 [Chaetomium olivicolor]
MPFLFSCIQGTRWDDRANMRPPTSSDAFQRVITIFGFPRTNSRSPFGILFLSLFYLPSFSFHARRRIDRKTRHELEWHVEALGVGRGLELGMAMTSLFPIRVIHIWAEGDGCIFMSTSIDLLIQGTSFIQHRPVILPIFLRQSLTSRILHRTRCCEIFGILESCS